MLSKSFNNKGDYHNLPYLFYAEFLAAFTIP